ncbi:MAG: branched-chain amino acid ABC transporter permease [Alphaproteobacteria bacterium]|nr:branched-chain amino acid ABC transporter permease [Alphaproteobacteria bacterium]
MLLETLVGGIALGFVYGLVALTLILLVRTTGVLNFAAADLGMFCAFIGFAATATWHVSLLLAMAATAVMAFALGALLYLTIILPRTADPLMLSLRTLGILIVVRALAQREWGRGAPYEFPPIVPDGAINVLGLNVSYVQIAIIVVTFIVALAVAMLTQWTRIGLMLRAISSDREAASELGVPVIRVDLVAWCLATLVAGIVGVLVARLNYLSPDMMQPILLAGFAAAQLGDMRSIRAALPAGIALGILQSASSVYLNQPEWSQVLAFAMLAIGLLMRSRLQRRVVAT